MKLSILAKTALTVAALTFSFAGAKAQYPISNSGGVIMLPTYGFYGPPTVVGPGGVYDAYGFGVPYGMGLYGYGGFGYSNPSGYSNYGYANPGYVTPGYGYANPYAYGGYDSGIINANPYAGYGNVGNVTIQGLNGPPIPPGYGYGYYPVPYGYDAQGNPVDANGNPITAENPNDNNTTQNDKANAVTGRMVARTSQPSPVQVSRAPFGRVNIRYNGSTAGVSRITILLQDRNHRVVSQELLTEPPAQAQLRRPASAKYWVVRVEYQDGTTRTFTGSLR